MGQGHDRDCVVRERPREIERLGAQVRLHKLGDQGYTSVLDLSVDGELCVGDVCRVEVRRQPLNFWRRVVGNNDLDR